MAFSRWRLRPVERQQTEELAAQCSLPLFLARLLTGRGYARPGQVEQFFQAESEVLEDPLSFQGMDVAVTRIRKALEEEEQIAVYGDYDCDGVTATALLTDYLQTLGGRVISVLPHRQGEGYGLNRSALDRCREQGVTLLITVDNGISALDEVDYAKELGMEVIVTDHHVPGAKLPNALAVIDPHLEPDCTPFCGAGLALMLAAALEDGDVEFILDQYADLAALGTISDVVPLVDSNRALVQRGLPLIQQGQRPGLAALLQTAGISTQSPLTAQQVAFGLGPRINAAGRMAQPEPALDLLTTEDPEEAESLAAVLEDCNRRRRQQEEEMLADVKEMIATDSSLLRRRVLCFAKEGWHPGIIGIAAARLCEEYGRPVMLLSGRDGVYTGSARSVGEFHLYQCLLACDSLLLRYGGHRQAAGFTIGEENLEAFFRQVEEYAAGQPLAQPELWLDGVLSPQDLTVEQIEKLSALEPFGEANPVPVFLLPKVKAAAVESIGEGKHTRYRMDWMGTRFTAVQFRITPQQSFVQPGQELDLAAQISLREFRGRQYLSVQVLELRPSGLKQTLLLNGWNYYFRFFCGEELPSGVAQKAVPTRQQAVLVYRLLQKKPSCSPEQLYCFLYDKINYFSFRICLDMMEEAQLIRPAPEGGYQLRQGGEKVDLMQMPSALRLRKMGKGDTGNE